MWSMHKASLMLPWWLKWYRRPGFNPWVGKIPWRRKRQPTPVFLPEKSHGLRSLEGYCLWGLKEPEMTQCLNRESTEAQAKPGIPGWCWASLWEQWPTPHLRWLLSQLLLHKRPHRGSLFARLCPQKVLPVTLPETAPLTWAASDVHTFSGSGWYFGGP